MNAMLKKFWRDEDGGESVEWPLVVGLIAVVAIVTMGLVGDAVDDVFNTIESPPKSPQDLQTLRWHW
jgi:Flp pilus assembly pilin Flp